MLPWCVLVSHGRIKLQPGPTFNFTFGLFFPRRPPSGTHSKRCSLALALAPRNDRLHLLRRRPRPHRTNPRKQQPARRTHSPPASTAPSASPTHGTVSSESPPRAPGSAGSSSGCPGAGAAPHHLLHRRPQGPPCMGTGTRCGARRHSVSVLALAVGLLGCQKGVVRTVWVCHRGYSVQVHSPGLR
jgi:hypothetical protein